MLIYVDICVFRNIDMDGCKLYAIDIIIHDTEYKIWYVNVLYSIHTVAFLYCICTGTSHCVGCECMVGKSTLHLVFNWMGSVNGTTSNRGALLIEMTKKICAGYQQERIYPPLSERPANYDQT